ncbi:hypothetical protein BT69DRAFT_1321047 [Atractiella rhizophila]|nr:hypothetical protein BT69DRAFT_1321047 [Atractiella rhizophila]
MDSLPHCPLIIKASFERLPTARRITFPSCRGVDIGLFKSKIAQSFSLPPTSTNHQITYQDDDGDVNVIDSLSDLIEAILYFSPTDEDDGASVYSSSTSGAGGGGKKVTMRVTVGVEYDGPSLSEGGSLVNGTSGRESASGWSESQSQSWMSESGDGDAFSMSFGGGAGTSRSGSVMGGASSRGREMDERSEMSDWRGPRHGGHGGGPGGGRRHGKGRHRSRSRSRERYHHNSFPPPHPDNQWRDRDMHKPPPRPGYPHPSASYPAFYPSPPGPSYPHARPPPPPPPHAHSNPYAPPPPPMNQWNYSQPQSYPQPPHRHGPGPRHPHPHSKASGSYHHPPSPSQDPNLNAMLSILRPDNIRKGSGSGSGSSSGGSRASGGSGGGRSGSGGSGSGTGTAATSPGQNALANPNNGNAAMGGLGMAANGAGQGKGKRSVSPISFDYSITHSTGTGRTPALTADNGSTISSRQNSLPLGPQSAPEEEFEVEIAVTEEPSSATDRLERRSLLSKSHLSSLPNYLLRCSNCKNNMEQIRYVCTSCGPLLPKDEDEDDDEEVGTTREEYPKVVHVPEQGPLQPGVHVIPVHIEDGSELASRDLRRDFETLDEAGEGGLVTGGYELCAMCIESEGLKHALACAEKEKSSSGSSSGASANGVDEGEGSVISGSGRGSVLRHVFGEVMKSEEGEWREVEYADVVRCSICGTGPILHNRFKCLSCPKFELCLNCYRRIEDIHPVHAFLAVPDRPAPPPRFVELSPSGPGEASSTVDSQSVTSEQFREAILRARGIRGSPDASFSSSGSGSGSSTGVYERNGRSELPVMPLSGPQKHVDVMCFGCLAEIVGPRFHCAVCPSFDLCAKCESISPPISSPDGYHDQTHILLKIIVPVEPEALAEANDRARRLTEGGRDDDSASSSRRRRGGGWEERERWDLERRERPDFRFHDFPYGHGPPFGPPHHFWGHHPPPHRRHHGPPPPPPVYLINAGGMNNGQVSAALALEPMTFRRPGEGDSVFVHDDVLCNGCDRAIVGMRWLCANCSTDPSYNLCEDCEKSSQIIHDPLHAFLRLPRPLERPLPRLPRLLPILYQQTIGSGSDGGSSVRQFSSRDRGSQAGSGVGGSNGAGGRDDRSAIELRTFNSIGGSQEEEIMHKAVICDFCMKSIKGAWMCCACCAGCYDLCYDCLQNEKISHDQRHVFLKLIRPVDMVHFKELTNLHAATPRALLGKLLLYD